MKRKDRILTENELLLDSPNNYMSESQLKFFKNRLELLANELLQNADETTEHLRETSLVPDPADRASIEEEHSLELRTRDRERKLLKKIKEAILRIDKKEYGYCLETGEEIGLERLLARPTATLSLEAQQRREKRQKQFGDI
ncbi:MAG: RNA polymerase-binding protein DksA [Verrucomicrobiales bacterium]|nr:RNA polymerase-binding protein DksA [Verrucomicrobiales bacterium]|tara:strand:+ start:3570 stop:3995 length:426 start_codon:yes stop_codon:yes gene_type:complete